MGLLDSFYVAPEVLSNEAFRVGYSSMRPLWVAYRLDRVEVLNWDVVPLHFVLRWFDKQVSANAFSGSGYDRGHMAPNFAIATRYGRAELGRL